MGRDTGAGAARLERLLRPPEQGERPPLDGGPGAEADPWHGLVGGGDRGRHVTAAPAEGSGWRLGGVPTGATVAAVVAAAVAAVLLLGGGGTGELVVGPGADVGAETVGDLPTGPPGPVRAAVPAAGSTVDGPALAGGAAADPAVDPDPAGPPGPSVPGTGLLVVHVDGAVARPGVVSVPAGSRVSDAVAAAGGVTADADTRLVNLARLLADGELVVVPVPGDATAPVAVAAGGAPGASGPSGGAVPEGPLDLNAADAVALDGLPGIGPVLAERIVAHRDDVGPFASVDDLDAVSGIGPSLMAELRALVTV